jgi:hypothetical protein
VRPDQERCSGSFHERGREPAKRFISSIGAGENNHTECDTGALEVEEVTLHVLPRPLARFNLEPGHGYRPHESGKPIWGWSG